MVGSNALAGLARVIGFAFAGARVETPHGQTFVDIPVKVRNLVLYYMLDGVEYNVPLESAWAEGAKGYGVTDKDGGTWWVKRTGGCGC